MTQHALDLAAARDEIRAKVVDLASRTARRPTLGNDDVIPETGLLDSAAIMELIVWIETRFGMEIDQADLTLENFGTVNAIARYLVAHAGPMA
ncbi:MAG TPA: phosphopantetheine-binding protein [Vicinamibacterales bacterium]|nr:phosphopantetheine-binding protein [Vicinamibacterales bacterium]